MCNIHRTTHACTHTFVRTHRCPDAPDSDANSAFQPPLCTAVNDSLAASLLPCPDCTPSASAPSNPHTSRSRRISTLPNEPTKFSKSPKPSHRISARSLTHDVKPSAAQEKKRKKISDLRKLGWELIERGEFEKGMKKLEDAEGVRGWKSEQERRDRWMALWHRAREVGRRANDIREEIDMEVISEGIARRKTESENWEGLANEDKTRERKDGSRGIKSDESAFSLHTRGWFSTLKAKLITPKQSPTRPPSENPAISGLTSDTSILAQRLNRWVNLSQRLPPRSHPSPRSPSPQHTHAEPTPPTDTDRVQDTDIPHPAPLPSTTRHPTSRHSLLAHTHFTPHPTLTSTPTPTPLTTRSDPDKRSHRRSLPTSASTRFSSFFARTPIPARRSETSTRAESTAGLILEGDADGRSVRTGGSERREVREREGEGDGRMTIVG